MRRFVLLFCIIVGISAECQAQWKDFLKPPLAFGVHDTSLFGSMLGRSLYRYAPSTPDKWVLADTGIPGSPDKHVQSFGSVGSYFFAGLGGGVYRSSNNGSNWTVSNKYYGGGVFATVNTILFNAGDSIYRSTDYGLTWKGLTRLSVTSFAVLGSNLFAGTPGGIWNSSDSGNSWKRTSVTSRIDALCVIGSTILAGAGTNGGILRSTDGGVTWNVSNKGLFNPYVNSLVTDGRNVFAGTGVKSSGPAYSFGSGVFLSRDSGLTWDTVNANLPWLSISTLCVFDTLLIAGAWDGAMTFSYSYIRSIPEMAPPKSGVQAVASIPLPDSLEVYPNPASGVITIHGCYFISRVSVLNVLGAEVLDVPSQRGSELTLDLSHLASGTYFLRIETAEGIVLRKVIRE